MFVLTADQVDSRHDTDRVAGALSWLLQAHGSRLALPPDRNAGDELQAITMHASTALDAALALTRTGHWSVGLGVGAVRLPLPGTVREASGPAFISARAAVEAAKKATHRFWLDAEGRGLLDGAQVHALVELVLTVRARRSEEGWAVVDLLHEGLNQASAAARLGITPQAVSLRLSAAQWRVEEAARPALVLLLEDLDRGVTGSAGPLPGAS
jgi:hypothetical protein